MARRQTSKENVRNLQKSNGTYYISIPIRVFRELGWKERQKVVVKKSGKGLSVKDWPNK